MAFKESYSKEEVDNTYVNCVEHVEDSEDELWMRRQTHVMSKKSCVNQDSICYY